MAQVTTILTRAGCKVGVYLKAVQALDLFGLLLTGGYVGL